MRAARLHELTGPAGVTIVTTPDPDPLANEVRIRVTHCGLNRADVALTTGTYGGIARTESAFSSGKPLILPHPLGIEPVGHIDAVGASVNSDLIGTPVAVSSVFGCGACESCLLGESYICDRATVLGAWTADRGGLDELLCVPFTNVLTLPVDLPLETAATVSVGYATAAWLLSQCRSFDQGCVVLIKGATGSIGMAAIDLVLAAGAIPVALTRSKKNGAWLRERYGCPVLVGSQDQAGELLQTVVPSRSIDIVVEPFGGSSLLDSLNLVRKGGHIALAGSHVDTLTAIDLSLLVHKSLDIVSTARAPMEVERSVIEMISTGQLNPVIAARFSLTAIRNALEALNDPDLQPGKVLVDVS